MVVHFHISIIDGLCVIFELLVAYSASFLQQLKVCQVFLTFFFKFLS